MSTRKCKRCNKTKPLTKFKKVNIKYRTHVCLACKGRVTYYNSKDKISERRKRRRKDNPAQAIWQDSRASDKKKGRKNNLTKEAIASLISSGCSYCGEQKIRITLDRIDNSLGHLISNVVPACLRCNYLRGSMPYKAWLHIAPKVKEAKNLGLFGNWKGQ